MDFRAGKTDIMQIQKLLSGFIVGLPSDPKMIFHPKNYESTEGKALGLSSFGAVFEDGMKEIDTTDLNAKYHNDLPLLLEEEKILRAFQLARDIFLYTNRRLIDVDTKGLTGKRIKYKSVPYKHVHGFAFETAGHLDNDAEAYAYTTISQVYSNGPPRSVGILKVKQSMLVKYTNVYEIGQLLLEHVIFGKLTKEGAPKDEEDIVINPEIEIIFKY
eukprot:767986-Ditylum_brightwellii.AAC.1